MKKIKLLSMIIIIFIFFLSINGFLKKDNWGIWEENPKNNLTDYTTKLNENHIIFYKKQNLIIDNQKILFKLDTGAGNNGISKENLKKINKSHKIPLNKTKLISGIIGTQRLEVYNISFKFHNKYYTEEFLILDKSNIIGSKFLKKNNILVVS